MKEKNWVWFYVAPGLLRSIEAWMRERVGEGGIHGWILSGLTRPWSSDFQVASWRFNLEARSWAPCCQLDPVLVLRTPWMLACLAPALSTGIKTLRSLITFHCCSGPCEKAPAPFSPGKKGKKHEDKAWPWVSFRCWLLPASCGWREDELSKWSLDFSPVWLNYLSWFENGKYGNIVHFNFK